MIIVSAVWIEYEGQHFMTPINEMIVGGKETSLQEANDIIWDNKLIHCLLLMMKAVYCIWFSVKIMLLIKSIL